MDSSRPYRDPGSRDDLQPMQEDLRKISSSVVYPSPARCPVPACHSSIGTRASVLPEASQMTHTEERGPPAHAWITPNGDGETDDIHFTVGLGSYW